MNILTRTITTLAVLCLGVTGAEAYDWKPQSNESLRTDMLEFASGFADTVKGTKAGRRLERFVRKQTRVAARSPYAWIDATVDMVMWLEGNRGVMADDGSAGALFRRNTMLLLDFPLYSDDRSADANPELVEAFRRVSEKYRADARTRALQHLGRPAPADGRPCVCAGIFGSRYVVLLHAAIYNIGSGAGPSDHVLNFLWSLFQ